MVDNRKKQRQNGYLIIHFPTSEGVSGASERANGRASGPVRQSVFLAVIDHSVLRISLHFTSKTEVEVVVWC